MINLLPLEEKEKIKAEYRVRVFVVILFFVFATIIIATVLLLPRYLFLETRERVYGGELSKIDIDLADGQRELKNVLRDTKRKVDILESGADKVNVYHDIFLPVLENRNTIEIDGISYENTRDDDVLLVSGISPDRDTLLDFIKKLEQNPSFGNVELPVSNFIKNKDIEFSMDISVQI